MYTACMQAGFEFTNGPHFSPSAVDFKCNVGDSGTVSHSCACATRSESPSSSAAGQSSPVAPSPPADGTVISAGNEVDAPSPNEVATYGSPSSPPPSSAEAKVRWVARALSHTMGHTTGQADFALLLDSLI